MVVAQKNSSFTKGQPRVHGLDECRNIQKGSVFIIASGASAKDFPLHRYADVPMITMNGAISKFTGTGIKPFFYVCTDQGFSEQQPDLFTQAMRLSERVALWESHVWHTTLKPQGDLYLLRRAPKLTWRDLFRSDDELIRSRKLGNGRNKTLGFSKNLKRGFFDARTVAYLALQLAYHVGFSKVFLVGVDLDPSVGRFYEVAGKFTSPCVLDEHFFTRILPSFEILSKYVMNKDFQVYNLSANSRIPTNLVPRVTLDELDRLI
ncbi:MULTISPECIES: lipopolysaccharide biosynthesis protein [Pseudomonas]|uniref:Lipopolysaccharide biosynthesis protein n=1 Tax=Pseudomonas izuensis TaxID=2684212 RepID=A0ABM7RPH4_9PSED|nr:MULTISPECIES: lipopolysaccharide biosynthesis protein [Pseudomonas]RKS28612.1 KDO transferase-3 [Pseudomonas sp. WPR_5_2]BCX67136.1 lipopolysaccharide biosynthesis protein [Pseudomonas izuensis]